MDAATIIAAINTTMKVASAAIQLGKDAAPFAQAIYETIGGKKKVTQADLDALAARTDALSNELQQPIPDNEQ